VTRYKLTIEYTGTPFVGWQRQSEGDSIQQVLEEAVFKFSGERTTVYGAGRTDAGVHALAQVAHLDLEKEASAFRLAEAVNFHVKPHPIAILDCVEAAPDFHARYSAIERRYRYRIVNRRAPLTLDRGRAWRVGAALDAGAMHAAAQILVGNHDFTSFRAADCQAESPVKTLDELSVSRFGEEIEVTARARSFLHHQVRNMVGTLKLVGDGKWTARDVKQALAARDRAAAGATAPADGLYLVAVKYPGPA
jgi:tRNA pseudouridine38-40 synthase